MTSRTVQAHFQCDCTMCSSKDARIELTLNMDGRSWSWMWAEARKLGWILSPNGKYCCAPGHEKYLDGATKKTHKHH